MARGSVSEIDGNQAEVGDPRSPVSGAGHPRRICSSITQRIRRFDASIRCREEGKRVILQAEDFNQFVRFSGQPLLRAAYLLSGDRAQAEDLVQEALVKAHRQWTRTGMAAHPEAYVRKIVVNEYVSWRRRRASGEIVGLVLVEETERAEHYRVVDDRDALTKVLRGLSPRARAVLVLRYYLDQPDHEIAAVLGITEGSVRSVAARAFAALRNNPDLAALIEGPARGGTHS